MTLSSYRSSHRSSYRPGAWLGVVGSPTTLLLPESEKPRIARLWSLIDDGAAFDEVLDALLQEGLAGLPGFALIGHGVPGGAGGASEEQTTILARGAVRVSGTAGGHDFDLDGSTALTWVERTLDDVGTLAVEVGGIAVQQETDDLPILGGLVRVSRMDFPAVAPVPATEPEAAPVQGLDQPVDPPSDEPSEEPVDEPSEEPSEEPVEPVDEPSDEPGDPQAEARDATTPPPVGPYSAPLFADDPLSAPLPSAPAEQPTDHDGLTRTGILAPDGLGASSAPVPEPASPHLIAPVAVLRFSDGEVVDVDRVVLVGRAPEARRSTGDAQPRLVKVHSPLYEISSTHVEVRPGTGADHGTAVVTDMGSTNGTVLDQPGMGAESLRAGVAVQLIPGATINLGDGVSIQVTRP